MHYLDHQREVVTRRTKFELDRAERRAHVLEGYLIALDHLDEVIALIRAADDTETARSQLMERFGLTEIQAQAILDMRLRALTGLERKRIKDEHDDLHGADRRAARDPGRRGASCMALIREELLEIAAALRRCPAHRDRARRGRDRPRAADRRRGHGHLDHRTPATSSGSPLSAYRAQGRGGVGVIGHGHQGGRLHRAPVRRLDPRLPAVLHERRQGLPGQGARAARPATASPRAARWSTCCRCARTSG